MDMPKNYMSALFARAASAVVIPLSKSFLDLYENHPMAFAALEGVHPLVKKFVGQIVAFAQIQSSKDKPHDLVSVLGSKRGAEPALIYV